jgi:hypothetical protein
MSFGYRAAVRHLSYHAPMNIRFGLILLLTGMATAQSPTVRQDWELVRSVPDGVGGTIDLVLIPEAKQRDRENYGQVAGAIKHIPKPKSGWIPVSALAVMTASYERSPTYKEPVLDLACWLYPSKKVGESEKCAYYPGAKKPPDK